MLFAHIIALYAAVAGVTAPRLDVRSWQLGNGLSVLILEDHKAPIASVQVFYHAGSRDETVGTRGVAHMFEHMMFKGSEHVPPEAHARLLHEAGGLSNAFTTEDVTAYQQTVPASQVGFALQLEAERMRRLKLFPSTVDSERNVMMDERRQQVDTNLIGRALEVFRDLVFGQHPYRWTAAGVMDDLRRITPAECKKFYDTYYVPNNATVIVVGDVVAGDVRNLVEQHFGSILAGDDPPRAAIAMPPQTAMHEQVVQMPIDLPLIIGGYHIPAARHADIPVLQVLASVLGDGESSRLFQRLVRQEKLALGAGGDAQVMEDAGLFLVYAVHPPDSVEPRLRQLLLEEIVRVRTDGVTADELGRAKNQLAAQFIYGLESVDGLARELGVASYVLGDHRRFTDGTRRFLAVSADDIKRVAARYLVESNLTLLMLRPQVSPPAPGLNR